MEHVMTILSIPLRKDITDWIEQRVARGEHASAEDYVSMLVERDRQERSEQEQVVELRQLLVEAEASGVGTLTLDEIFEEAVRQARHAGTYRD
jgi:antitoxin ParD1/3/4